MTETQLIRAMLDAIAKAFPGGVVMARTQAGMFRGIHLCPKGWPDLSGVAFGRACFIEVKLPGGKVSPEQEAMHERLRAAGGRVFVCRGVDEALTAIRSIPTVTTRTQWGYDSEMGAAE